MKQRIQNQKYQKFKGNFSRVNRPFLITFSLFLPGFFVIFILPSYGSFGNIWREFRSYSYDFQNYLQNQVPVIFTPFDSSTNTSIHNASGDLGIPNPNITQQELINQLSEYPTVDLYENNLIIQAIKSSNALDRQITRGALEGNLGKGGQARIKNSLQSGENAISQTNLLADKATINKQQKQIEINARVNSLGGFNIANINPVNSVFSSMVNNQSKLTQLTWEGLADLELKSIKIQQEENKILVANLGTNIKIHQDLQYSNLNLANISAEIEDINRDRRIENASQAAKLLRVASQSQLLELPSNWQANTDEQDNITENTAVFSTRDEEQELQE